MRSEVYCYVWEYEVRPEHVEAFEHAYGSQGEWVRLFRHDPEYIRTELLRDRDSATRFMTIDYWTSSEACLAFRKRFENEFCAIDAACETLTLRETHLGDFSVVS